MTPERINAIAAGIGPALPDGDEELFFTNSDNVFTDTELRELCRLALLGLRVEEAPTCSIADAIGTADALRKFSTALLDDKRVALVVLP